MAEPLYDQVMQQLEQAVGLYYRLILVVAPRGAGQYCSAQILLGEHRRYGYTGSP
jgi:hypothetical protein